MWLFHEERELVYYANSEGKIAKAKSMGFKETDENYAIYYLLDIGYKYTTVI